MHSNLRIAISLAIFPVLLLAGRAAAVEFESTESKVKRALATPVRLAGDVQEIEFQGHKAFTAEQIRNALAGDLEYQAAARPSGELANLLEVLKRRIEHGYAHSGILAKVAVSFASHPVVVVKESPGPMVFRRFKLPAGVESPELIDRVSHPELHRDWTYQTAQGKRFASTSHEAFVAGEVVQLDKQSLSQLNDHLQACLADTGRLPTGEAFDFDGIKVAGKPVADCTLTSAATKPELTIGEIEIHGLTRHSREEILALIEIAPGEPLTHVLLQTMCDKLQDCHRFWQQSVDVHLPKPPNRYGQADGNAARIVITLVEYEPVPKLGEEFSEVDQVMLRTADWMANLEADKEDFVIEYQSSALSVAVVASPSKSSCLMNIKGEFDYSEHVQAVLDHSVIVEPGKLSIYDWETNNSFICCCKSIPYLKLSIEPSEGEEDGQQRGRFKLDFGITNKASEALWQFEAHPMALLYTVRLADDVKVHDGLLTTSNEAGEAAFDVATGRLLRFDSTTGTIVRKSGEFAKEATAIRQRGKQFPNRFEKDNWGGSVATFLFQQLSKQPYFLEDQAAQQALSQIQQVVNSRLAAECWNELFPGTCDKEHKPPKFAILPSTGTITEDGKLRFENYSPWILKAADRSFERGSWPWTFTREAALTWFDEDSLVTEPTGFGNEMVRIYQRAENGPVFFLLMASFFEDAKGIGKRFAAEGLKRLDEDSLRRDLAHFTEGDLWAPQAVEKLAELAVYLNDEQRALILNGAPKLARKPLAAFFNRRKINPLEPPREAVEKAILEAWRNGWRDEIWRELQDIAGPQRVAESP